MLLLYAFALFRLLFMDSKIGLMIQIAAVFLITVLTLFLRRSIKVTTLKHWTNAWLFLSFSLFCLLLASSYQEFSSQFFSLHFLTEYLFGFLLIAGCRTLTANNDLHISEEFVVLPFILLAFALPFLSNDLDIIFNVHSLIMSGFFAIAMVTLWRFKPRTFGWRIMLISLGLLTLNFLQDVAFGGELAAFHSLVDLVLQVILGFGMVIILLEKVLADAKVTNERLTLAHRQLEEIAHVDPLTTALNRHAFYGYLKQRTDDGKPVSGSLGFFDIDDLKTVNDVYGHTVGDVVIRSVVRALREIVRAEDLIFRWGGDEFFVIMISLDAELARERMERLEEILSDMKIDGVSERLSIKVSYAFENFEDVTDLESTLKRADAGMYRQKQLRKGIEETETYVIDSSMLSAELMRAD